MKKLIKIKFTLFVFLSVAILSFSSCRNQTSKKSCCNSEGVTKQSSEKSNNGKSCGLSKSAVAVLDIDAFLGGADSFVGKMVTIEGVCTHTCRHGATKMFLMGSDDSQTIRVQAGELGSFDTKCVNSMVQVKGIVKEDRIDETYLRNWEAKLKEAQVKEHGKAGEGGCSSEKKARGEVRNTPQDRIADFREKITIRQTESGKAYLSFYHIVATEYEIQ